MSKHIIFAFRIGGDIAEQERLSEETFITTKKDLDKIQRVLFKWTDNYTSIYVPCERCCKVAQNITNKQLEKFNLTSAREILGEIFKCYGVWIQSRNTIMFVNSWNKEGGLKEWWNDFKEELEEAKYNPRNPLGKLEFDRRAEADGIVWKDDC